MNKLGYAHSVECWDNNKLIGGLYGVHIKSCFFGESSTQEKNLLLEVKNMKLLQEKRFQMPREANNRETKKNEKNKNYENKRNILEHN